MSDKTVLVTGCTSGIGLEVSKYLHEQGYGILLVGRNEERLKKVSEEIGGQPYVVCNLEESRQIPRIFDYCINNGLKLSGMVHCAGLGADVPIRMIHENDLKSLMQVHYFAFVELCKHFYNRKISEDGASIVAISSISSITKRKGSTPYSASKNALNTAVQVASKEFVKRLIRVNALLPAYVDTHFIDNVGELTDISKVQPMGLIPTAAVAGIVEFLLSDKSKYITGALIPVTAGMEVN